MPTGWGAWPPARSAADRCPWLKAGEFTHAWKASSSRHRVTTSQVVRPSVGLSSSKPSKPSWSSTAPARAANRRASSSPLSAGTVIALILTTVTRSTYQPAPGTELLPGSKISSVPSVRGRTGQQHGAPDGRVDAQPPPEPGVGVPAGRPCGRALGAALDLSDGPAQRQLGGLADQDRDQHPQAE